MFLTVHASSGIFIGSQITTPWLAFIIGFISHWFLDTIPHGDEKLIDKSKYTESQLKKRLFHHATIDTFGIIVLFYLLTNSGNIILTSGILWGMLGAVAPDYLWGIHKITPIKILKPLHKIHTWFHNLISNKLPFIIGGLIQLLTLIIFIFLIIYMP